jgi:hypothetical protein
MENKMKNAVMIVLVITLFIFSLIPAFAASKAEFLAALNEDAEEEIISDPVASQPANIKPAAQTAKSSSAPINIDVVYNFSDEEDDGYSSWMDDEYDSYAKSELKSIFPPLCRAALIDDSYFTLAPSDSDRSWQTNKKMLNRQQRKEFKKVGGPKPGNYDHFLQWLEISAFAQYQVEGKEVGIASIPIISQKLEDKLGIEIPSFRKYKRVITTRVLLVIVFHDVESGRAFQSYTTEGEAVTSQEFSVELDENYYDKSLQKSSLDLAIRQAIYNAKKQMAKKNGWPAPKPPKKMEAKKK